jgi:peptide/nickel transport system permease protein
MGAHLIRRISLMIPNVFILTFLLFSGVTTFLGSPAALMLGEEASPEAIQQINEKFGFDRPVLTQYASWVAKAATGDFGRSYSTQQSVGAMILPALPMTLELSAWAIILAVAAATIINSIPFARKSVEGISSLLCIIGITIPNFFLGICFIYILSVRLRWLPTTGWVPWSSGIGSHLTHLIMPVLTLTAFYFGSFSLIYKAEYRATSRQLFVKVARAKGLGEIAISFKHILPNSILPVITYAGLSLGQLVGGAVVTESVFSMPGIGRLLVNSIGARDFPVMLAIGMIVIVGVMIMNLLADLLYGLVNPVVRLAD